MKPHFSVEKWGFIISTSIVNLKAVQTIGGLSSLDPPILSRR